MTSKVTAMPDGPGSTRAAALPEPAAQSRPKVTIPIADLRVSVMQRISKARQYLASKPEMFR